VSRATGHKPGVLETVAHLSRVVGLVYDPLLREVGADDGNGQRRDYHLGAQSLGFRFRA
jgi:hypothetical protein